MEETKFRRNPKKKSVVKTVSVHSAAEEGSIEKLQVLSKERKERGYPARDTYQQREDVGGAMPLHFAAENGHVHVVKHLLEHQVDPHPGDNQMVTPLHLAAVSGHNEIVKIFLNAGVDAGIKDNNGSTALHWAASKGQTGAIKLLLRSTVSQVNLGDKLGWTPLHRAAFNGRLETCEFLCKEGAYVSAVNQNGETPLHLAARSNRYSVMRLLMDWGSSIDFKDQQGNSPLTCANENGREMMMQKRTADSEAAKSRTGSCSVKNAAHARTQVAPQKPPTPKFKPSLVQQKWQHSLIALGNKQTFDGFPEEDQSDLQSNAPASPSLHFEDPQKIQLSPSLTEAYIRQQFQRTPLASPDSSRRSSYDFQGTEQIGASKIQKDINDDMSPWGASQSTIISDVGQMHSSTMINEDDLGIDQFRRRMRESTGETSQNLHSEKRNKGVGNSKFLNKYGLKQHGLFTS